MDTQGQSPVRRKRSGLSIQAVSILLNIWYQAQSTYMRVDPFLSIRDDVNLCGETMPSWVLGTVAS